MATAAERALRLGKTGGLAGMATDAGDLATVSLMG